MIEPVALRSKVGVINRSGDNFLDQTYATDCSIVLCVKPLKVNIWQVNLLAYGQRYINITRNAIGPKSGQKDCRKF